MADQNESDLLAALEETKISEDDSNELVKKNQTLQELFRRAIDSLKEKNNVCLNLEKQNKALNLQVTSLKEIVAITKNLLSIRNAEVETMQKDLTSLQEKINAEKDRHSQMITSIGAANKLNENIKNEYQNQMRLFQELREKYNQKVSILADENEQLKAEVQELKSKVGEQIQSD